uniref:DUF3794 domain-containing protein n=1 Tax=Ammonifex degensii TaxID=42838 RepID=A0A7C1FFK7_9THEO
MVCADKYELLKVNQVIGEGALSFTEEREISLGPEQPGVETLLSVKATPRVVSQEVLTGKVLVEGEVDLQLTYVACVPEAPVYAAHLVVPFVRSINVAGALPGMHAHVTEAVTGSEVRPKEACSREFDAAVTITLQAKVTEHRELEVLVEAPPGVAVRELKKLRVDDVVAATVVEVPVVGKCRVSPDKPAVAEILDLVTETEITRVKTAPDEVFITGNLHSRLLYQAATAAGPVHHLDCTLPFRTTVTVPGVRAQMKAQVGARVVAAEAWVEDTPTRAVEVEALLSCRLVVVEPKQLNVVMAVDGNVTVARTKLQAESVVGENDAVVVLSGITLLPLADPPAEQVLATEPLGVTVKTTEIVDDTVVARGFAEIRVIYTAATPEQGVYAASAPLEFVARVRVEGASPHHLVHVSPVIDYAVAKVKNAAIVVDAAVAVTAKVTEMVLEEVITCITLPEAPPTLPGRVIQHTVAPGDTFYALARQYGTPVEAIMAANPGVDPNNLQVGQVINIPVPAVNVT